MAPKSSQLVYNPRKLKHISQAVTNLHELNHRLNCYIEHVSYLENENNELRILLRKYGDPVPQSQKLTSRAGGGTWLRTTFVFILSVFGLYKYCS